MVVNDDDLCACGHIFDEHDGDGPCQATFGEYDSPGDTPILVDELPCTCIHFELNHTEGANG